MQEKVGVLMSQPDIKEVLNKRRNNKGRQANSSNKKKPKAAKRLHDDDEDDDPNQTGRRPKHDDSDIDIHQFLLLKTQTNEEEYDQPTDNPQSTSIHLQQTE